MPRPVARQRPAADRKGVARHPQRVVYAPTGRSISALVRAAAGAAGATAAPAQAGAEAVGAALAPHQAGGRARPALARSVARGACGHLHVLLWGSRDDARSTAASCEDCRAAGDRSSSATVVRDHGRHAQRRCRHRGGSEPAPALVHAGIDSFKLVDISESCGLTFSLTLSALSLVVPLLVLLVRRRVLFAG
jgi:hypothetical protein